MSYYTYQAAADARRQGLPWKVRLEYTGYNGKNASGNSYKFWEANGVPGSTAVTIRYGRIGSAGRPLQKDWGYFAEKFPEKQAKGYDYDSRTQDTVDKPPAVSPVTTLDDGTISEIEVSQVVASTFGPGPYGQIRSVLRSVMSGTECWSAYDEHGTLIMQLPEAGVETIKQAVLAG